MGYVSPRNKYFNYYSILPSILFLLGVYIVFLFITGFISLGIIVLLFCFVLYVINNIVMNTNRYLSNFDEFLDYMAVYMTFTVTIIVFGVVTFKDSDALMLSIIFFFAMSTIYALARNWQFEYKNSCGWPAPLNGLFFPIFYYIYIFYLDITASSIFMVYFIVIGVLSSTNYNFLGYTVKDYKFVYVEKGFPRGIRDGIIHFYEGVNNSNNNLGEKVNGDSIDKDVVKDGNKDVKNIDISSYDKKESKDDLESVKKESFWSKILKGRKKSVKTKEDNIEKSNASNNNSNNNVDENSSQNVSKDIVDEKKINS